MFNNEIELNCPECGKNIINYFQPILESANPDNDGFNIQLSSPLFKLTTKTLIDTFKAAGSINFLTLSAITDNDGREFEVTIRAIDGISPAEAIENRDKEITRLKKLLEKYEQ